MSSMHTYGSGYGTAGQIGQMGAGYVLPPSGSFIASQSAYTPPPAYNGVERMSSAGPGYYGGHGASAYAPTYGAPPAASQPYGGYSAYSYTPPPAYMMGAPRTNSFTAMPSSGSFTANPGYASVPAPRTASFTSYTGYPHPADYYGGAAPAYGGPPSYTPSPAYGGASSYTPAPAYGGSSSYTPAPAFGGASSYTPPPAYGGYGTPSYGGGGGCGGGCGGFGFPSNASFVAPLQATHSFTSTPQFQFYPEQGGALAGPGAGAGLRPGAGAGGLSGAGLNAAPSLGAAGFGGPATSLSTIHSANLPSGIMSGGSLGKPQTSIGSSTKAGDRPPAPGPKPGMPPAPSKSSSKAAAKPKSKSKAKKKSGCC